MHRFTEEQWTRLNTLLDEQEARTQRQLATLRAATKPASHEAPLENADLADQEAGDQANDIMLVHYRNELAQVDATRQRMQEEQYGICVDCGEAIPFLRLQAQPTALRCLTCQAERERGWG
ncbi:TraR/DksA family transcriptional regulator [Ralstonia flaminis]|jgi:DnaK suppressor protein|uniref:RNA polymerase-binding transcription factor DksA n=1 Tax=Ralstonia flaminis TaxID=3058597 RepID=A0ABM9K9X3_9RALS|nr:TraR/DksA family transcriptional regulator [Ralstonia sp. LMG 18101]CAJ0817985.1 RNA polymerase-binding transcription factor DksA [Ralstonia sp. LMG 18101]